MRQGGKTKIKIVNLRQFGIRHWHIPGSEFSLMQLLIKMQFLNANVAHRWCDHIIKPKTKGARRFEKKYQVDFRIIRCRCNPIALLCT